MNVIEKMKDILSDSEILDVFNGVHIDYNEAYSENAGLYSNGAVKIGEDLNGNPIYRLNFQLYTGLRGFTDYDRNLNAEALLALTYYLDRTVGEAIEEQVDNTLYSGEITKITASNAMLFDVPTGDYNDGVRYQIQIAVQYKIFIEE